MRFRRSEPRYFCYSFLNISVSQQLSLLQQLKPNYNSQQKMGCVDSQPQPQPAPVQTGRQRTPKSSQKKLNRLQTNVNYSQIRQISNQERKAGFKPVYACPICTLRFNKILACQECNNCICHSCFLNYQKKARKNFRCCFCSSETSIFRDYQLEARSYFDTTGNNGFLSVQERNKIDQELQKGKGQGSKLEPIAEVEAN